MAVPRLRSSNDRRKFSVTSFILGVFSGGAFLLLFSTTTFRSDMSTRSGLLGLLHESTTAVAGGSLGTTKIDGWNSIHVYYGKRQTTTASDNKNNKQFYAQVGQDQIVLDIIGENGYFIDLAANDAIDLSNTYALEQHGWNGLCIEPNPTYWSGLAKSRTCQVVAALVGGSESKVVPVKFRGVYGGVVGLMDDKKASFKKEPDVTVENVYTASFAEILQQFGVPKVIDFLSLDVEGSEFIIMQHFPFDTYQIRVMTVENPTPQVQTLLESHGYRYLKKLAWWGETLWAHQSTGLTSAHPKIAKIKTEEQSK
jgi:hypothetical protein